MSLQANALPAPGTKLVPHLTVRSVLGEGATAVVYEAFHHRLGVAVAVKLFTLEGDHARDVARRLVREARICARLDDPHVPRVYDVACLEDGRPYIVMERVDGATLYERLQAGPLDLEDALSVTRQLLGALRSVHASRIVHRDLKPANILLEQRDTGDTHVRLMDFGIAHLDGDDPGVQSGVHPTKHGQILGTPGYMAPEQICGERVDARADLYALGVTLFEMLAGEGPFDDDTTSRMLHRPLHEDVPDLRERVSGCPTEVAEWVRRATAREPQDRFGSADEALAALPASRQAAQTLAQPRGRTRWPLRTTLAAAVGLAAWFAVDATLSGAEARRAELRPMPPAEQTALPSPALQPIVQQEGDSPLAARPESSEATGNGPPATGKRAVTTQSTHSEGTERQDSARSRAARSRPGASHGYPHGKSETTTDPHRGPLVSDYLRQLDQVVGGGGSASFEAPLADAPETASIPPNPY